VDFSQAHHTLLHCSRYQSGCAAKVRFCASQLRANYPLVGSAHSQLPQSLSITTDKRQKSTTQHTDAVVSYLTLLHTRKHSSFMCRIKPKAGPGQARPGHGLYWNEGLCKVSSNSSKAYYSWVSFLLSVKTCPKLFFLVYHRNKPQKNLGPF
jgi:hypothetical protein